MAGDRAPNEHDWSPVAPAWERNPDDKELWRRAAVLPGLALNAVERELLGAVAGRTCCLFGIHEGTAALALAALGARLTVVDSSQSMLDMLMIRARAVGVEINYVQSDHCHLSPVSDDVFQLAYAAHSAQGIESLADFYAEIRRILCPGGRLVVNEYHPFRRIWKQEPGHPEVQFSYFDRRRLRDEGELPGDPTTPCSGFGKYDFHYTVSDHVRHLLAAGLQVRAIEEVGDVRQKWEIPNMKGLPEQLIIAADRPA